MVKILSQEDSVFNTFLSEIRDEYVQQDRLRFRKNMERMGQVMAYEISKKLFYQEREVITPLGVSEMRVHKYEPILATVLRAGLPFHQGFLDFYDGADSMFIAAYRNYLGSEEDFEINVDYLSGSFVDDKIVILIDPMIATGQSIVASYKAMLNRGLPKQLHIASVVCSAEGLEYLQKHLPANTQYWLGAVDDEMTAQGYVVPGLGDAGDLSFGEKL